MIGLAIAVIVAGVVLLLFVPWVGIPIAAVGALLVLVYFVGFARRRPAAADKR